MRGRGRIRAGARSLDDQLKKRLKPSRQLVDYAACGDVDKMLGELKAYADPNSRDKDGQSVIEAAAANGQVEALEVLLDYKPAIPPMILTKVDESVLKKTPAVISPRGRRPGLGLLRRRSLEARAGEVRAAGRGLPAASDRNYTWSHVPPTPAAS